MNDPDIKLVQVQAEEELPRLVEEALVRIDIITNGIPELAAEFKEGSNARTDVLPIDPNQSTSWRGGWMTTDLEIAGNDAYFAGEPFDPSKPVFWKIGYLGQKALDDGVKW
jgi:hypothetical protein